MINKATDKQTALKCRIRQFYTLLNARRFERCYRLLDPRLLEKPGTVTLFQYENALAEFLDSVGTVKVREVAIHRLHLNEPSKLYEGRDFALGRTGWEDAAGKRQFSERWVCEGATWFTRSTGLLVPAEATPRPSSHEGRPRASTWQANGDAVPRGIRTGVRRSTRVPRVAQPDPLRLPEVCCRRVSLIEDAAGPHPARR